MSVFSMHEFNDPALSLLNPHVDWNPDDKCGAGTCHPITGTTPPSRATMSSPCPSSPAQKGVLTAHLMLPDVWFDAFAALAPIVCMFVISARHLLSAWIWTLSTERYWTQISNVCSLPLDNISNPYPLLNYPYKNFPWVTLDLTASVKCITCYSISS